MPFHSIPLPTAQELQAFGIPPDCHQPVLKAPISTRACLPTALSDAGSRRGPSYKLGEPRPDPWLPLSFRVMVSSSGQSHMTEKTSLCPHPQHPFCAPALGVHPEPPRAPQLGRDLGWPPERGTAPPQGNRVFFPPWQLQFTTEDAKLARPPCSQL